MKRNDAATAARRFEEATRRDLPNPGLGLEVDAHRMPPPELRQEGGRVKNLSTSHGPLSYRLSTVPGGHVLELAGEVVPPAGGVRLAWPLPGPRPRASNQGLELDWQGRELVLPPGPATIGLIDE